MVVLVMFGQYYLLDQFSEIIDKLSMKLSKNSDNEAQLETLLNVSSEDVNKVNQMMSYTQCRLSHCALPTTRNSW